MYPLPSHMSFQIISVKQVPDIAYTKRNWSSFLGAHFGSQKKTIKFKFLSRYYKKATKLQTN